MTGQRRLSQAISEGDGISVIACARDLDTIRLAEEQGAEAVILDEEVGGAREATALPVIRRTSVGALGDELRSDGADACVVSAAWAGAEPELAAARYAHALESGLECVITVRNAEELETALDLLDPEIFLLAPEEGDGGDAVERILDLLPDVPAGKLAIAEISGAGRDDVVELERAGVDGVIVASGAVAHLVGSAPPDV